jgi:hypothetical protein
MISGPMLNFPFDGESVPACHPVGAANQRSRSTMLTDMLQAVAPFARDRMPRLKRACY